MVMENGSGQMVPNTLATLRITNLMDMVLSMIKMGLLLRKENGKRMLFTIQL